MLPEIVEQRNEYLMPTLALLDHAIPLVSLVGDDDSYSTRVRVRVEVRIKVGV